MRLVRVDIRDQKEVGGWDEAQVSSVCLMDEVSPFIQKRKTGKRPLWREMRIQVWIPTCLCTSDWWGPVGD